jgi:hypothetical protein
MVVQDGGAHLRSSGAEDLLQWTDAQWQKAARAPAEGLKSKPAFLIRQRDVTRSWDEASPQRSATL